MMFLLSWVGLAAAGSPLLSCTASWPTHPVIGSIQLEVGPDLATVARVARADGSQAECRPVLAYSDASDQAKVDFIKLEYDPGDCVMPGLSTEGPRLQWTSWTRFDRTPSRSRPGLLWVSGQDVTACVVDRVDLPALVAAASTGASVPPVAPVARVVMTPAPRLEVSVPCDRDPCVLPSVGLPESDKVRLIGWVDLGGAPTTVRLRGGATESPVPADLSRPAALVLASRDSEADGHLMTALLVEVGEASATEVWRFVTAEHRPGGGGISTRDELHFVSAGPSGGLAIEIEGEAVPAADDETSHPGPPTVFRFEMREGRYTQVGN